MKQATKNRTTDYRFKILYAFGMVSILVGHGATGFDVSFGGWFPYYSFELPLFMFCSGYFFNIHAHEHTWSYIWKKVKKLIIPLFAWNIFYALFVLFISNFGFQIGLPVSAESLTTKVITSGHQFMFNLSGWFVIPLFMTQVFSVTIRRILAKCNWRFKEWYLAALYFVMGALGIWLARCGWGTGVDGGWPLVLTRMMALMPFFGLGILYKNKLEKNDKLNNLLYFSIIAAVQLILIMRNHGAVPGGTPSWSKYPGVIGPLLCGITGIAFYLRIAKIVEPVIGKSKIVNKIADNTFAIMIHHFLGFWLVTLLYGLVLAAINRGHFNWDAFHISVWYKYYPHGIKLFGIVYLAAGLAVPLAIQNITDRIKNRAVKSLLYRHRIGAEHK